MMSAKKAGKTTNSLVCQQINAEKSEVGAGKEVVRGRRVKA